MGSYVDSVSQADPASMTRLMNGLDEFLCVSAWCSRTARSDHCQQAGDKIELRCDCQHPPCR